MKRIFLFIVTNLAVMLVLGVVASLLGVNQFLTSNGLNLTALLGFSMVMGFGGAFISLLLSKTMAKWSTGAQIITQPQSADEEWLLSTVRRLSEKAGIEMPEVAIYEGEANAFATGAFKNSALVAVSTGLLQGMTREEVEAVLGHEVAHIANGDMVTLTLIQGVLNTFVVFLSRVVGYMVDSALRKNDEENTGPGIGYYITSIILDIVLGFVASMIVAWFSRQREFKADAGAAHLLGRKDPMIHALQRLGGMHAGALPSSVAAMGITSDIGKLFSTHPPIEERIAALQAST
ncbi:MAG: protease HtpX [Betaproteobacteria bacterium]|jgi:heat shock protein HtpX|nr:protease HtpX [Betaproteobacteria bacterium]NBT68846.1 protease HtpX [Betaproteobacteria bacterium]NBY08848.1 protease HtpX [Betaproteobacteria bacterium]